MLSLALASTVINIEIGRCEFRTRSRGTQRVPAKKVVSESKGFAYDSIEHAGQADDSPHSAVLLCILRSLA